jgi:hypothetical protein
MLYEGTTGIQSLDLLGRKIIQKGGEPLKTFIGEMAVFCKEHQDNQAMSEFIKPLSAELKAWGDITMKISMSAMQNPDEINAACVDYLMYAGYVTYAYFWARAAAIALENKDGDEKRILSC